MEDITIVRNFGILYRTYLSYISKSIATKDISFSDSVFLVNIGENEGISQEEIANALVIDKAAIARSVKSMEQKGYLISKKSASDKRAKELYLSETGKALFQYLLNLNEVWLKNVLGDLEPDEARSFAKIINSLSAKAKSTRSGTVHG